MKYRSFPLLSFSLEITGYRFSRNTTYSFTKTKVNLTGRFALNIAEEARINLKQFGSVLLSLRDTTRCSTTKPIGSASHLTLPAQSVPLKWTPVPSQSSFPRIHIPALFKSPKWLFLKNWCFTSKKENPCPSPTPYPSRLLTAHTI
jgi:hypothetical protein